MCPQNVILEVKDSKGINKIFSLGRNHDKSTQQPRADDYELRSTYYRNSSDPAVCKIVCRLYGTYTLLFVKALLKLIQLFIANL